MTWGNGPSATSAVTIGGRMLFSPSAYLGGAAAPMAWRRALTKDEPLVLQLEQAQEPAPAAYPGQRQHQGERVAEGQPTARAATGDCPGWANGIAGGVDDGRVPVVMEPSGASPQPRLTGPLLPRGTAGPGPAGSCGACPRVGYPMHAPAAPQRLSWA